MKLNFIINGEVTTIAVGPTSPLYRPVDDVLHLTNNTGRPVEEWECRDATGVLLETHRSIQDLHLLDGARLFLSVRVGAGGANG